MSELLRVLGFVGTIIVAVGYFPQLWHLAREHCSAGISSRAWWLWLLGGILIVTHAFEVSDLVFVSLQSVNIAATAATIWLAKRYAGMTCAFHKRMALEAVESTPGRRRPPRVSQEALEKEKI